MKHLLSTALTSILLGSSLVLGSCKKDDDNAKIDPSLTGSITGKFSPVDAITQVKATNDSITSSTFTAVPNSSGVFSFDNINAGTYTLSFTAAPGYAAPAPYSQVVRLGQISGLGTITVRPSNTGSTGGTFTYKLNGAAVTATAVTGVLANGALNIVAVNANQSSLALTISGITGPGTFAVGGTSASSGTYTVPTPVGASAWSSVAATAATIEVTSFDTVSRKASGTFSFAANPVTGTGATGSKTITNGVFTNVSF